MSVDSDVASGSILLVRHVVREHEHAEQTEQPAQAGAVYRVHEFAERAGVTVRALHHYDRLGLLTPARRSAGGYRLYTDRDLGRLEQIVVLKFLGLPLKEIRRVLLDEGSLPEALRTQLRVLAEKRRQLDQAIYAIAEAERALRSSHEPDSRLFRRIIKEIDVQTNNEWSRKYYSDEAKAKVEARKTLWSPGTAGRSEQGLGGAVRRRRGVARRGPRGSAGAGARRTLADAARGLHGWRSGNPERPQQDVGRSAEQAGRGA
jgi:DNA-binding transcriptional MerR regulator